ncbi:DEAD/DEAH box helicase [Paenarthrobacter aurescens]|uniref:DEAD/DEAH box helicase n=1 Tax=Paenarthrobacter aurescens TaxID=43663 RepID=A0A4Y3NAI4_PAEAU|nr:DEAD/DEAH box helicase [Paenarthrobacter aurescens]MDO6142387.1 DEAD/DEAH box helicase [Paenarthrobacter aurescens]MDO6146234.1 DEAD/DEAH box helicase [Paenarthrobacter aurescens]MDO6157479.1 DEAD/DEAH box helicase [Paenarthrobacter aurescens]MDO6161464.1 DEAD/DEAH box helicase [Paenarthrobacter aurescens]GEB18894.1 DEAD/DEAH box helicase [Paenarthrobacter aurescens]
MQEPQASDGAISRFSQATREWFLGAFSEPTPAQDGAWNAISSGSHALVVAPTGSGKTLAAFLWALDRLHSKPSDALPGLENVPANGKGRAKRPKTKTRVLYISPLKALGVDVERNLRAPLIGITQTAKRLGLPAPLVTVGVRSGDTTAADRRTLLTSPPDILITTPESLFLMLTSRARETLSEVDTIIIDEVHAVAGTKRGAHLAVSLERLDALLPKPAQRIGLSATVQPRELVAQFLAGQAPVEIVAPPSKKNWNLTVTVPVEDMSDLQGAAGAFDSGPASGLQPQASIWPHVEEQIVDLVLSKQSTIVFANSRRLSERLTARLNEIYAERQLMAVGGSEWAAPEGNPETGPGVPASTATPAHMMAQAGSTNGADPVLARAHHGSVSKDQRAMIEDDLKSGRLRCVVATSSLELGIDMGAVDLVVQVESPPSVASGLQRVGRAGHQVGEISEGVLFPKHRADLLHTSVTVERMLAGQIERLSIPANPLDILAQQTVAATALGSIDVEEWFSTVRRSAPFASLPRSAFEATLDLLAGRYPSDEFAELRPRIIWDRHAGTIEGRPGAQRLAVTSGGTIPDRGLFGVYIIGTEVEGSASPGSADGSEPTANARAAKGGRRVGELDEEMVYESRVGDVFALGATSWKIEDITHDRVLVSPAFGQPGKLPFWKGDSLGRPVDLGRALGAFIRELSAADEAPAMERCQASGLDAFAASNLIQYLREQKEATEIVPNDRTLVVERFHDELGDWRVVLHSPFGMPVHAPWALAVGQRLQQRYGLDGSAMAADDGIVLRVPMMEDEPPGAELFLFDPEELEQIVTAEVGGSALFASRFRECAARALLLPRQNPAKRQPLWQQRQRSAQLLDVAKKYPSFPIVLEAVRECLQDVYDLPALKDIAASVERRELRIVETTTQQPSPFAKSLLFGYVAQFLYEGDSPLAERRAAALALDSTLLNELLGRVELRELLDAQVIDSTELELQRLAPDRRVRGMEGVADLLRLLGPLSTAEVAERLEGTQQPESSPQPETRAPSPADAQLADAQLVDPQLDDAQLAEEASVTTPSGSVADAGAHLAALQKANRALKVTIGGVERFAAIEDAARLRDAIGVPLPMGVPLAFIEPVHDPLGDLVSRYARTHGPFTASEAASRLGLGVAVVNTALRRLADDGRVVEGEFRPHAVAEQPAERADSELMSVDAPPSSEWCDAEVLRKLRRRSLAALRAEVEPVDTAAYGRFLPAWQNVTAPGKSRSQALRGLDGIITAVDQLSGVPIPASAWEPLVLASRVADYKPAMLDELMAAGELLWSGAGSLPGNDGWISLHVADSAELTLNPDPEFEPGDAQQRLLEHFSAGGGYFFRQLTDVAGGMDAVLSDDAVVSALWDLVWAGRVTGDTFAPVRAMIAGGKTAHRQVAKAPRARAPRMSRLGRSHGTGLLGSPGLTGGRYGSVSGGIAAAPPSAVGRWSALPAPELDPTIHARGTAELLLDRYGVVTRGSVMAENIIGGFGLMYKVLARLEEAGRCRRGYFIEHLGAAQFAVPATVDRLRSFTEDARISKAEPSALALAATDPANPYGAALPWPALSVDAGSGHRPGRKAGALVVMVDGALILYVERGGKTLLTFSQDDAVLTVAAQALVDVVRRGAVDKLFMEKVNGHDLLETPIAVALAAAGAYSTPKGLRIRA